MLCPAAEAVAHSTNWNNQADREAFCKLLLTSIWENRRELPSLSSRIRWAKARGVDPLMVNGWFSDQAFQVPSGREYDLPPDEPKSTTGEVLGYYNPPNSEHARRVTGAKRHSSSPEPRVSSTRYQPYRAPIMRGAIIEKLQDEAKWLNYRPALPHDEVLPLISDLTEPFIEKYLSMDEASMLIYDIGKQNNKLAYINSTYAQDDFDDIRRMIKMAEVTIGPLIKDRWTLVRHIYYRVRDEQILQPQGGPEPLFSSTGGKCSETFCHILPATLALCRHDFKIMADEDSAFAGGMIFEYIGRKTTVSDDERRICGRHDKDQKIPTISEYKVVLKPTVRFVLVVEKMTVTRGIIDCGILENHKDLIGEGVIVSGKGVPDINVRGVLNQVNIRYPGVKICALGDFDPFGIGIVVQTYKQGGASLPSYARKNTVVPSIQFYGLLSGHCESNGFTQRAAQAALLSERDQGRLKALLNDTKVPQECKNELTTMQERGEKVSLDMILQLNTTDLAQWVQNIISTALSSPSNAEPDITPNTRRVPFINTPPREDKEMLCSNLLAEVTRRFDIKFTQLHSDRPKHAHMLQIRHNRLLYFKDPEKKDLLLLRPTHFDISKSEFCKSGPPKEITPEDLPMILSDMGRDVRLLTSIRGLRHLQGIGLGTTIHQIPLPIRMTLDGLDTFLGNYGGFTEIAGPLFLPPDDRVDFRSLAIRFQFYCTILGPKFTESGLLYCDYCKSGFKSHESLKIHILVNHKDAILSLISTKPV